MRQLRAQNGTIVTTLLSPSQFIATKERETINALAFPLAMGLAMADSNTLLVAGAESGQVMLVDTAPQRDTATFTATKEVKVLARSASLKFGGDGGPVRTVLRVGSLSLPQD